MPDYRPLADWMAVQALPDAKSSFIVEPFQRGIKVKRGRVLKPGPLATLPAGTIVWYEAHSAHPSQSAPIPADWFGGDEGEDAFLLRAPLHAAPSSEADDKETEALEADIERLRGDWQGTKEENIPKEVRRQMTRMVRRRDSLDAGRVFKRRSRRLGHTSDTAVRAGIFAIEEPE